MKITHLSALKNSFYKVWRKKIQWLVHHLPLYHHIMCVIGRKVISRMTKGVSMLQTVWVGRSNSLSKLSTHTIPGLQVGVIFIISTFFETNKPISMVTATGNVCMGVKSMAGCFKFVTQLQPSQVIPRRDHWTVDVSLVLSVWPQLHMDNAMIICLHHTEPLIVQVHHQQKKMWFTAIVFTVYETHDHLKQLIIHWI